MNKVVIILRGRIQLFTLIFVLAFVVPMGTVHALPATIIDSCVGVDHPEFEREYQGDGYSYLNVGLTLPLQDYAGASVTGLLEGGTGKLVEAADRVDADGRVFLSFPLYSYDIYKIVIKDEEGQSILEDSMTVGDKEQQCDRESLKQSPPAEQESGQEPEQDPEAVEDTPAPETATEDSSLESDTAASSNEAEDNNGTWWPYVAIALGVGLAAIGSILMRNRANPGPCDEKRRAWEAAEKHAEVAREAVKRARERVQETANVRIGLDAELTELRHTYPSAGRPGGNEAWVELDGKRITSRDVALRREAEQAAWEKYRQNPNPETAAELEKAWNDAAEPSSEQERREIDERARQLEQELNQAREAEKEAQRAAEAAEQAAEQAADYADEAKRIYEECIGKASVSEGESSSADGGEASTTTNQGEGSQTRKGCCREDDPPQEKNKQEWMVTFPVSVEVELHGGDAHAAAKEAKEISGQLADISEKLGWISKAMDIKGIGTTLIREGAGWQVLGESVAPVTGAVLGTPVPTSPGQAVVDYLSVAANIASVIVGKVPELQARRLPDCDISIRMVSRTLRVTCSEIWVCRDGQWVFDRKRFALTVVREGRTGAKRYEALTWAQAQAIIVRYENMQMYRLQNAIDEIARYEAGCRS